MGKGLAAYLAPGRRVTIITTTQASKQDKIKSDVHSLLKRMKLDDVNVAAANLHVSSNPQDVAGSKLVVECVSEDIDVKRATLTKVKPHLAPGAYVATNTSSLSVESIFEGVIDSNVFGLHFFNPVHAMKLVEVVRPPKCTDATIEFATSFVTSIGKQHILVTDSPGFVVNRLLIPMLNEASKLVDENVASVEDVDKAMTLGCNHPMGPLKLSDFIGNDITLAIANSLSDRLQHGLTVSELLKKNVEIGKLGRKSNSGFYCYPAKK